MQVQNKGRFSKIIIKIAVVNLINLLVFISLIVLLRELPTAAQSVKKTNSEKQVAEHLVDTAVLASTVEKNKEKTEQLASVLNGDQTVILFVSQMDELKKTGVLAGYEFPIVVEITDKYGLKGLPFLANIVGTKEQANATLSAINNLKLLIRPLTLAISIDELGVYTITYGAFLYTK